MIKSWRMSETWKLCAATDRSTGMGKAGPVALGTPTGPWTHTAPMMRPSTGYSQRSVQVQRSSTSAGGAGRFALPLATRAKRVTVVESSEDSLEILSCRAEEAGITNITVINESWEDAQAPRADMVLCSLVLHHVPEVVPFVSKLQDHAIDRVVLLEMTETPGAIDRPFYERVYGSSPSPLPGLARVMEVLWAMDIYPDLKMLRPEPVVVAPDREAALEHMRHRLGIEEATAEDERLLAAADELLEETPDGITVRGVSPHRQAIVTWKSTRQD